MELWIGEGGNLLFYGAGKIFFFGFSIPFKLFNASTFRS